MRKILCIVLAFAICSFCVFPYVHAEDTATDLQTQREELQNQLNDANWGFVGSGFPRFSRKS